MVHVDTVEKYKKRYINNIFIILIFFTYLSISRAIDFFKSVSAEEACLAFSRPLDFMFVQMIYGTSSGDPEVV